MKQTTIYGLLLFLLIVGLSDAQVSETSILNGVVHTDNSKVIVDTYPVSIDRSGPVYINITTKSYTGDADIGLLSNGDLTFERIQYYNPHQVGVDKYLTCKSEDELTYVKTPEEKIITCYDNESNIVWSQEYDTINIPLETIYWTDYHTEYWSDVGGLIEKSKRDFDGLTDFAFKKSVGVVAGETIQLRVFVNIPYNSAGKYGVFAKPSSLSLNDAISSGNYFYQDPWYDTSYAEDFFVQRGNFTLPAGSTNITLTAGVDYETPLNVSHTLLKITGVRGHMGVQGDTSSNPSDQILVTNTANIETNMYLYAPESNAQNRTMFYEIIEYTDVNIDKGNEFVMRDTGYLELGMAQSTEFNVPNITNSSKVMVILDMKGTNGSTFGELEEIMWMATFNTTSNNVTLEERGTGTNRNAYLTYYVIEWVGDNWGSVIQTTYMPTAEDGWEYVELDNPLAYNNRIYMSSSDTSKGDSIGADDMGYMIQVWNTTHVRYYISDIDDVAFNHTITSFIVENIQVGGNIMNNLRVWDASLQEGGEPEIEYFDHSGSYNTNYSSVGQVHGYYGGDFLAYYNTMQRNTILINETTVMYIRGNENIVTATTIQLTRFPTVDKVAPQLSVINVSSITNESAIINLEADESFNYSINYGTTISLGSTLNNATFTNPHNASVSGLLNNTQYFFNVSVWDDGGNSVVNGTYNFTTTQNTPDSSCTADGTENHIYQCSDGCNITSAVDFSNYNVTFNGTGRTTINASLTNMGLGSKTINSCIVRVNTGSGGFIQVKTI